MLYTYQEALARFGSRGKMRQAVKTGRLFPVTRNLYSTQAPQGSVAEVVKLHAGEVVSGHTALYVWGLTDLAPDRIDLASKRGGTKISDPEVRQHFVAPIAFEVGKVDMEFEGSVIPVYDRERLILDLYRDRNKLPYDFFRDCVAAFRRISHELDTVLISQYAERLPRGAAYFEMVLREVF